MTDLTQSKREREDQDLVRVVVSTYNRKAREAIEPLLADMRAINDRLAKQTETLREINAGQ